MFPFAFSLLPQLGRLPPGSLLLDLLMLSPLGDLLLELARRDELFRLLCCFGHLVLSDACSFELYDTGRQS